MNRNPHIPRPDLMPLVSARLVRISEPDESQRLQEGWIKELTSGDPVEVHPIAKSFVEVDVNLTVSILGR